MISQQDMEKWLQPWPIKFRRRHASWDLKVLTVRQAGALTAFWKQGAHWHTIRWFAQMAIENHCPVDQHEIHSLTKHYMPTCTSLVAAVVTHEHKSVVVDGNHRLVAAVSAALQGLPGPTHVGVLFRKGKKR